MPTPISTKKKAKVKKIKPKYSKDSYVLVNKGPFAGMTAKILAVDSLINTYKLTLKDDFYFMEGYLSSADIFKKGDKVIIKKPENHLKISKFPTWTKDMDKWHDKRGVIVSHSTHDNFFAYNITLEDKDKATPDLEYALFLTSWLIPAKQVKIIPQLVCAYTKNDKLIWKDKVEEKEVLIKTYGIGPFIVANTHATNEEDKQVCVYSSKEPNCGFWKQESFFEKLKD